MKSLCCKTISRLGSVSVLFLLGCQSLPSVPHLPKSQQLTQSLRQSSAHPLPILANTQRSGYHLVSTGANAFAIRSLLTDHATHSIDAQYYIWHDDEAGLLMLKHLWQAAERGVVVRLLLDDINSSPALDQQLLAFASHPNIAVRLVNPFVYRRFKFINYLSEPVRLNRRMHNKSMTFDRQVSIIGGRNIGNEYLNNDQHTSFADLDVLVAGEVVKDIRQSFDEYWQSSLSYDIETLVRPTDWHPTFFDGKIDSLLSNSQNKLALQTYQNAIKNSQLGKNGLNDSPLRWADMVFLADDVSKLHRHASDRHYLINRLRALIGRPRHRLSIISSYFVPTKDGVHTLTALAKSGVKVSILTNSFDATDVGAVHAGYGHWRRQLLQAGVRLYELKSTAKNSQEDENKLWRTKQITTTSLHAKAFAIDEELVFIGSYNIDPRSANLNSELGVLIKDHQLARQLHHALNNQTNSQSSQDDILRQAYQVELDTNNQLQWRTLEGDQEVIYQSEPSMNLPEKTGVWLLSLLPIDWLL